MKANPSPLPMASLPNSHRWVMSSKGSSRDYQISVAFPSEEPPPQGFPIIYLLDGNSVFGTMVESVRLQSRIPARTGIGPAMVVGIGYETDAPFHLNRHYDYTLPVAASELPPSFDGKGWPDQGGADLFLSFIEEELKPYIEQQYPVNKERQILFGHSLGGLFTLHTLFTKPESFQTYIAGSPSIAWNERLLLEEEKGFYPKFDLIKQEKHLFLSAGELERSHESKVNEKAEELAKRLSNHIDVVYEEFANENHISVLPVLISRAIRFSLKI
ncbi:alpha/beta hydrolase [Robertmurraya kyonggiensis]|uniref:Alpha/beta hydrolase n=1 Tax=Robertmurraya kyonggiensis TaxID=1037680 RepID=A0A4U1D308_9BACI|nr:alpha/beta hydrolase-fold protein [Robertmurraya kyonggiensis]TKC16775.1 alpha/beta hydrolase [Robertmurraya kyonggiensis]